MKYYIDKDDAVKIMYTFLKQAHDMDSNNDRLAEVLTIAKNVVNEIPHADVVPVRHGRWDADMGGVWCSVCGEYSEGEWDYCPYCGARMDGDNDAII